MIPGDGRLGGRRRWRRSGQGVDSGRWWTPVALAALAIVLVIALVAPTFRHRQGRLAVAEATSGTTTSTTETTTTTSSTTTTTTTAPTTKTAPRTTSTSIPLGGTTTLGIRDRAALADQERGPLEAEITALHAKGAVVSGDVPFEKPPAHAYWGSALVDWCRANGGTLEPIITKAPDISGPPDHYCKPTDGVRYWPPTTRL